MTHQKPTSLPTHRGHTNRRLRPGTVVPQRSNARPSTPTQDAHHANPTLPPDATALPTPPTSNSYERHLFKVHCIGSSLCPCPPCPRLVPVRPRPRRPRPSCVWSSPSSVRPRLRLRCPSVVPSSPPPFLSVVQLIEHRRSHTTDAPTSPTCGRFVSVGLNMILMFCIAFPAQRSFIPTSAFGLDSNFCPAQK